MDSLLIRLDAPMQSWGVQSRFDNRDSAREPTKSGIIGLLCAALGRARWEPLDDLTSLKMGVRVDREGVLKVDYQTIKDIKPPVVSHREYLANAVFLVGLEGEFNLLETLQNALLHPRWSLYLGRKAFPPAEPVWLQDGLRKGEDLYSALTNYERMVTPSKEDDGHLRLVLEDPITGETILPDVPVSFQPRRYTIRRVHTTFANVPFPTGG